MKTKRIIALALALMMLLLTACQGEPTYCTDEAVLSLLKSDNTTPEFVLDGEYYELPVNLSTFTQKGWQIDVSEVAEGLKAEDVVLEPGYEIECTLKNGERSLIARVANSTESPMPLGDNCKVISVMAWNDANLGDSFVTKHGITLLTSPADVNSALKNAENLEVTKHSTTKGYALMADDDSCRLLDVYCDSEIWHITVASHDIFSFEEYYTDDQKQAMKNEMRNEYKTSAVEFNSKYDDNYDQLITDLQAGTFDTVSYRVSGKVDKVVETQSLIFANSAFIDGEKTYLITNEKGNSFAVLDKELNLAEGDSVTVWGKMRTDGGDLLQLEDKTLIPVITPNLVEKDGAEIYLNSYID